MLEELYKPWPAKWDEYIEWLLLESADHVDLHLLLGGASFESILGVNACTKQDAPTALYGDDVGAGVEPVGGGKAQNMLIQAWEATEKASGQAK